jgi:hypothetical protein
MRNLVQKEILLLDAMLGRNISEGSMKAGWDL